MRWICRGLSVALATCVLAGCSGATGESVATPENPQSGLDALKKFQAPLDPKAAAKGKTSSSSRGK